MTIKQRLTQVARGWQEYRALQALLAIKLQAKRCNTNDALDKIEAIIAKFEADE